MALDFLNPFSGDGILSGGAGDRGRAASNSKNATREWQKLQEWYAQNGGPTQFGVTNDPFNQDTNTLHTLGQGPNEQAVSEKFLRPEDAAAAGLRPGSAFDFEGGSNFYDDRSAFDSRDPSAFGGLESEFSGMGPSAYEGIGYSDDALGRMEAGGDYFANLSSGGSDPIAEAQYARKVAEAEGSRKANTDAALAAEEARGAGSGSGRLLAELSNQQASVGDQYLAGMDANALAASRRDNAAGEGARIGQMIGSEQAQFDTARAGGLDTDARGRAVGADTFALGTAQGQDTYSNTTAAGQDSAQTARSQGMDDWSQSTAAGQDDWAQNRYNDYYGTSERNAGYQQNTNQRNIDHRRQTDATNNDLLNNAAMYNSGQRQQDIQNRMGITSGVAGGYQGTAGVYQQNSQGGHLGPRDLFQAGANVAAASAGKPPTK